MPRPIQPALQRAISQKVTAPLYLCRLDLHGDIFHLTSFDDSLTAQGQVWTDANLGVTGPTQKSGGTLQATITAPFDVTSDGGRALIDLLLARRPQDQSAQLWKTYWYEDDYTQPVLLLDGVIDQAQIGRGGGEKEKPRVSLTLVSRGNRGGRTPAIRLGAPTLQHLTPAGSIIVWNNGRWEVD